MILRRLSKKVNKAIKLNPAVVILGPRQVGKTTLALKQIDPGTKEILYLDLERPSDLLKLSDAEFFLSNQQVKLVVIDEVQRMPELFPILRSLIDENREAGRFILLGSASDKLIGMSAESLAGRVSYQELHPFSLDEVGNDRLTKLWITGGFPVAFQATNNEESFEWLGDFVRTYIERELGVSELKVDSIQLSMFLRIIASIHGQLINYSQLANVMQISMSNIKKYI
ncbi:MAG TPA: ATP-binding protein, partial [Saprospiraceae bacterium]|nr:ATP-binding protein [Saprospiraceae bacterium]